MDFLLSPFVRVAFSHLVVTITYLALSVGGSIKLKIVKIDMSCE